MIGRTSDKRWYLAAQVPWKRGLFFAAICALALHARSRTYLGQALEDRLQQAIELHARHLLGKEPPLDGRIKILALGDRENSPNLLDADEWIQLLGAVSSRRPAAIFVEHAFGTQWPSEKADALHKAVENGPPVIAAATLVTGLLEAHRQMAFHRPDFDLEAMANDQNQFLGGDANPVRWIPPANSVLYGPSVPLLPAFTHVGHMVAEGGAGVAFVRPFFRLDGKWGIPYLSLFAGKKISIGTNRLWLDGREIPLDPEGRIPVNMLDAPHYVSRVENLADFLDPGRAAETEGKIGPGDYVFIVGTSPLRRGNHKQKAYYASSHGAFVPIGVLNSVLTNRWLRPMRGRALFLAAACVAGAALPLFFDGLLFWGLFFGVGTLIIVPSILVFSISGIMVPWLITTTGFSVTALLIYADRGRATIARMRELKNALQGIVSEQKLTEILSNPAALQLEAAERVLTLMFVDIEGFSRSAKAHTPREAFSELRELVRAITQTVHEHGGVVDRTLGDGLLCVFGYEYVEGESGKDHADRAVACAVKIQRDNLERTLATPEGHAVYPLRVGINTAGVYIGDLGAGHRIDVTVIGDGVNFAQRLEAACESYRVMIGAPTQGLLLKLSSTTGGLQKRFIAIKHEADVIEAYELDPFHDCPDKLNAALTIYRHQAHREREKERWEVPHGQVLKVETEFGPGELINLSEGGVCLYLAKYLGKGVHFSFSIAAKELGSELAHWGMLSLLGEVRWGRPLDRGFLHGVQIKNLSAEQRGKFVEIVRGWRRLPAKTG